MRAAGYCSSHMRATLAYASQARARHNSAPHGARTTHLVFLRSGGRGASG